MHIFVRASSPCWPRRPLGGLTASHGTASIARSTRDVLHRVSKPTGLSQGGEENVWSRYIPSHSFSFLRRSSTLPPDGMYAPSSDDMSRMHRSAICFHYLHLQAHNKRQGWEHTSRRQWAEGQCQRTAAPHLRLVCCVEYGDVRLTAQDTCMP